MREFAEREGGGDLRRGGVERSPLRVCYIRGLHEEGALGPGERPDEAKNSFCRARDSSGQPSPRRLSGDVSQGCVVRHIEC